MYNISYASSFQKVSSALRLFAFLVSAAILIHSRIPVQQHTVQNSALETASVGLNGLEKINNSTSSASSRLHQDSGRQAGQASSSQAGSISSSRVSTERISASVIRVIDGDTLVVDIGGKQVRVRLIGIDSPEVVDPRKPAQCFGEEARNQAAALLDNKNVFLEKDASQGDYDKYGRLLAYVFLQDGSAYSTSSRQVSSPQAGMLFNELMLQNGYAREYTYALPYKYQLEFRRAEQQARESKRGLWQVCATRY